MTELAIGGFSLSIVLIVVVQALKKVGLPNKFIPLITLGLGLAVGIVYFYTSNGSSAETELLNCAILGVMSGATASGLYSQAKIFKKEPEI